MNRRLLSLARDSRFALAGTVLCGFLAGLLTIGQASALSRVVDRVFLGGQALPGVTGLLRLILVIIILRALLAWGSEVSANIVAVRIKGDLRQRLFDKILDLGPAYTRRERTGELVNAAVEGIEQLDAYFSQYLPQLVLAALVPFCILIVVFPRDLLSGLILLATAPLIPIFMVLIGKAAEVLTNRQWDTLSRLSAYFLDSLQGLTTLKELGRSQGHAASIAEASDHFRDVTLGVLRVTFLSALVLEMVATISTALIAVEVGLRLLYGHLAFQPALFLLLLAPEFFLPLRMLGLRFHAGMSGTTAAKRIFEVLDYGEQATGNRGLESRVFQTADSYSPLVPTLSLSALSFTYPGESSPALDNISLEVHPGEHIALVGSSGVGKSTLAALLLRLIEPASGQLAIGNLASTDIPPEAWRQYFAWVPQDPFLFHDTIASNLRLARPDATQAELTAAVGLAHLDQFIQALPEGYGTIIGEAGARLSAGQAQRLALARAFLKDAPILILDEPTSSLDPEHEALIEAVVRELVRNRTVITIAHRLNTVFKADRIIVLEGGRIVESGTHQELLAKNGAYAALVNISPVFVSLTSNIPADPRPSTFDLQPPRDPQSDIKNQKSSILLRLLSFLRGSWGWVSLSVFLGILTVGSNVGLMGTSAFLISAAALHPGLGTLQVAIVGVRFFGIARGVFRYAERLTSHNVTFRLLAKLRTWFFNALEPLAPARLMQYRSGDLLGRIMTDVGSLENFYVRVVSPALVAGLTATWMMIFFYRFAPVLAWTYSAFMAVIGLGVPLLASFLSRDPGAQLIILRASLQAHLIDGIQGLADLLVYGRGQDYAQRLREKQSFYAKVQRHLAFLNGFSSALTTLLVNLGMLSVLILAIPMVRAGRIPPVMLAVLALVALAGFEAVLPLPQAFQTLSSNMQAARRLFEIVDVQPVVEDPYPPGKDHPLQFPGPLSPIPLSPGRLITFENLSFAYPGQSQPVLVDISFQLTSGKRLAIVGPSGAGKSTLASLLLRFWDVKPGQILLGGQDVRLFPQDQIRRLFSFISQRSYFFNDTIRKNLLLAQPSASELDIQNAAKQAQIHEFIVQLPQGYETIIGERGFRLSGGERQRLAIARALLKAAPIFLLDEPTASLDLISERRILETLYSLAPSRSLLLITHRLVGLETMDEIIVLDHGRIVERGTHTELVALGGLYCRLWDSQNRMLKDVGRED